ncbi:hypothetical protein CTAYLR_001724 [Chrysophaeum taylorii]|uniref:Hikeshi-like domain-containing protein n=1 Tax=Chrysophaeum taylorii TaxID=2483200 RepID=A0AAD7U7P4_9STRA|nr:hypothetical protein CTAYLR_001724 [Chrysophaeum taylorii]
MQPAPPPQFGLIVPGRSMVTEFQMVDSLKCVTTISGDVSEVCFVLLAQLPINTSAVLYYTLDGVAWTLLGAVDNSKPSGIFRTPWQQIQAVQVGVSLESSEAVQNLDIGGSGVEERRAFARKIAQDLFTFLTSFATTKEKIYTSEMLVVPANVIDRWIQRFDEKYKRDPNFYLKT